MAIIPKVVIWELLSIILAIGVSGVSIYIVYLLIKALRIYIKKNS